MFLRRNRVFCSEQSHDGLYRIATLLYSGNVTNKSAARTPLHILWGTHTENESFRSFLMQPIVLFRPTQYSMWIGTVSNLNQTVFWLAGHSYFARVLSKWNVTKERRVTRPPSRILCGILKFNAWNPYAAHGSFSGRCGTACEPTLPTVQHLN